MNLVHQLKAYMRGLTAHTKFSTKHENVNNLICFILGSAKVLGPLVDTLVDGIYEHLFNFSATKDVSNNLTATFLYILS